MFQSNNPISPTRSIVAKNQSSKQTIKKTHSQTPKMRFEIKKTTHKIKIVQLKRSHTPHTQKTTPKHNQTTSQNLKNQKHSEISL